ncbi:MAG: type II toxin-antitoxin system VapB family antitoxin [Propionivibrio sp.]
MAQLISAVAAPFFRCIGDVPRLLGLVPGFVACKLSLTISQSHDARSSSLKSPFELLRVAVLRSDVDTWRICIANGTMIMSHTIKTAAVFKSGNSQAVRLPMEFQFDVREVEILRRGDEAVLRRIPSSLATAFDLLTSLPDDFMASSRDDTPPQAREGL